jgi:hypothetical protein
MDGQAFFCQHSKVHCNGLKKQGAEYHKVVTPINSPSKQTTNKKLQLPSPLSLQRSKTRRNVMGLHQLLTVLCLPPRRRTARNTIRVLLPSTLPFSTMKKQSRKKHEETATIIQDNVETISAYKEAIQAER